MSEIRKEDVISAIKEALKRCPSSPSWGHVRYVCFADIVYYLRLPLKKVRILQLLKLVRDRSTFCLATSFHPPSLPDYYYRLAQHRANVAVGLEAKSLPGWWKIVRWLVENGFRNVPLVGLNE